MAREMNQERPTRPLIHELLQNVFLGFDIEVKQVTISSVMESTFGVLSGVAGLGYEIVWARMFAVGLGHEFSSLLAVVVAFFGGFALGAWGLDSLVSRSGAGPANSVVYSSSS